MPLSQVTTIHTYMIHTYIHPPGSPTPCKASLPTPLPPTRAAAANSSRLTLLKQGTTRPVSQPWHSLTARQLGNCTYLVQRAAANHSAPASQATTVQDPGQDPSPPLPGWCWPVARGAQVRVHKMIAGYYHYYSFRGVSI